MLHIVLKIVLIITFIICVLMIVNVRMIHYLLHRHEGLVASIGAHMPLFYCTFALRRGNFNLKKVIWVRILRGEGRFLSPVISPTLLLHYLCKTCCYTTRVSIKEPINNNNTISLCNYHVFFTLWCLISLLLWLHLLPLLALECFFLNKLQTYPTFEAHIIDRIKNFPPVLLCASNSS